MVVVFPEVGVLIEYVGVVVAVVVVVVVGAVRADALLYVVDVNRIPVQTVIVNRVANGRVPAEHDHMDGHADEYAL